MLRLYRFQSVKWVKGGFSSSREQNQVAASERAESHPAEPLSARSDGGSTRLSVFARTVERQAARGCQWAGIPASDLKTPNDSVVSQQIVIGRHLRDDNFDAFGLQAITGLEIEKYSGLRPATRMFIHRGFKKAPLITSSQGQFSILDSRRLQRVSSASSIGGATMDTGRQLRPIQSNTRDFVMHIQFFIRSVALVFAMIA